MKLHSVSTHRAIESLATDKLRTNGFSLVEVTLALGVLGFVLLALISLISVGLRTGKESRDDMASSLLMQRQLGNLGTNTYATLQTQPDVYYTVDGVETNSASAYFIAQTKIEASSLPDAGAKTRSRRVRVEIAWPAAAPEKARQTNIVETHIADYLK